MLRAIVRTVVVLTYLKLSAANGPIRLLYHNNLDLVTISKHRSVLVLAEQSQSLASAACHQLGEKLLDVNQTVFSQDIAPVLHAETFQGTFIPGQMFWVGSGGNECLAVDESGHANIVPCAAELPVLCSQSSGDSAIPSSNNLINVTSKGTTFTGFRDIRTFQFIGIPYANKPERFTYATMYNGSTTVDATAFGLQCVQSSNPGVLAGFTSENCLFLNIYTPFLPQGPVSKPSLKPVMFWIHGGSFMTGSGSMYPGGNLASRGDVIVVTINYRLSTLGFLALNDGKTNGNYGISDQILALDWVREHIVDFGGDPDRITIFGESAGAASVRALMASPKAFGKFAASISMSNPAGSNIASTYSNYLSIPQEVALAANPILKNTGCDTASDTLACLRAFDPYLLNALPDLARYPVIDGTYLVTDQLQLNGTSPIANVHAMMGVMRDDGLAFIGTPANGNLSDALIAGDFQLNVTDSPLFPIPSDSDAISKILNVTSRVATNVEFRCLDQATAFSAVSHTLLKSVWSYEFNRSYQPPTFNPNPPRCEAPVDDEHPFGNPDREYYKCHSGELLYVFGILQSTTVTPYRDDKDLPFMQQMVDVWTSFARTFNPNPDPAYLRAKGFPDTAAQFEKMSKWEPVTKDNINGKPLRLLQWDSFMTDFREKEQCGFLGFPLAFYG